MFQFPSNAIKNV